MARRLILVVCLHPQHLDAHHRMINAVGEWFALPAPTLARARALLATVRPALVLYEGTGMDGPIHALHQALHGGTLYPDVHLTVLGPLSAIGTALDLDTLAGRPCAHCRSCPHCGHPYTVAGAAALVALLARVLGTAPHGETSPPRDAMSTPQEQTLPRWPR